MNPLLTDRQAAGRKPTLTCKAWISRRHRKGVFKSHVRLGGQRTHTLSTNTRQRQVALDFNLTHLLSRLKDIRGNSPAATENEGPLEQPTLSLQ
jgi:hypothetical protein